MALPTKTPQEPRGKAVTLRVTKTCYSQLVSLAKTHKLSQADVVIHLVDQEYQEHARLAGKLGRYKHGTAAATKRKTRAK